MNQWYWFVFWRDSDPNSELLSKIIVLKLLEGAKNSKNRAQGKSWEIDKLTAEYGCISVYILLIEHLHLLIKIKDKCCNAIMVGSWGQVEVLGESNGIDNP